MANNFHCQPEYHNGQPHYDYCRSPTACGSFGYCRKRNMDGTPMTEDKVKRLRAESDAEYGKKRR